MQPTVTMLDESMGSRAWSPSSFVFRLSSNRPGPRWGGWFTVAGLRMAGRSSFEVYTRESPAIRRDKAVCKIYIPIVHLSVGG